jgi:hypothetical protein
MKVFRGSRSWDVEDEPLLEAALSDRDAKGGAWFLLGDSDQGYPQLSITVSGGVADVHYYPRDGHAGFRCMAPDQLSDVDAFTTFVYEGCDPASGEQVPNEFVVQVDVAMSVAKAFLATRGLLPSVRWFEL